jgi:hypothetical protein
MLSGHLKLQPGWLTKESRSTASSIHMREISREFRSLPKLGGMSLHGIRVVAQESLQHRSGCLCAASKIATRGRSWPHSWGSGSYKPPEFGARLRGRDMNPHACVKCKTPPNRFGYVCSTGRRSKASRRRFAPPFVPGSGGIVRSGDLEVAPSRRSRFRGLTRPILHICIHRQAYSEVGGEPGVLIIRNIAILDTPRSPDMDVELKKALVIFNELKNVWVCIDEPCLKDQCRICRDEGDERWPGSDPLDSTRRPLRVLSAKQRSGVVTLP